MRRVLGAVGRTLVTVGLLILLFVAYQLWGTGIYESRQQSTLKAQFAKERAHRRTPTTLTPENPMPDTAPPPPSGGAAGVIKIARIRLNAAVVQGITVPDLRRGPGHYPLTPLPGELGNAAIAGHRTTYGAPFGRLEELAPDDPILVTTLAGTYRYKVDQQTDHSGHLIVKPTDLSVLDPKPDPAHPGQSLSTLTLTTCNPKFSAAQRLVVKATLDTTASPAPRSPSLPHDTSTRKVALGGAGLSGAKQSRLPALWWGLAVAAVGAAWWLVFHRYHRWTTWLLGVVPFLAVLFFFYSHLERLLPANY